MREREPLPLGPNSKSLPLISFVLASLNNPKNSRQVFDIISLSFQYQKSVLEVVKPDSQNNGPKDMFGRRSEKVRGEKSRKIEDILVSSFMCLLERMEK